MIFASSNPMGGLQTFVMPPKKVQGPLLPDHAAPSACTSQPILFVS
jgi:hypothetical protein